MKPYFKFPDGASHVNVDLLPEYNIDPYCLYIPFDPEEMTINDHLMMVVLGCDAKQRMLNSSEFDVFLPYLPYARQDRRTREGEAFSLQAIGRVLNTAPHRNIISLDVHSDVAFACVNGLISIPPESIWDLESFKDMTLVIPDQGAWKRLHQLDFSNPIITIKTRDTSSGFLKIEHVIGDVEGKNCLIIDDIVDGGATFCLLSRKLHDLGANSVELMVTHGIFSKGVDVLLDSGISQIYTTDSFATIGHENVDVIDVIDLIGLRS